MLFISTEKSIEKSKNMILLKNMLPALLTNIFNKELIYKKVQFITNQ
jgi:hypothetical protein